MQIINLTQSSDVLKISQFSGGETHIRFLETLNPANHYRIFTRLNSSDNIMQLLLAVDAMRRMDIAHIEVYIPYVPYARQDRVMNSGEPLSIKVFAELLNNTNFNKVHVLDPHSDVTPALINNCVISSNHAFVQSAVNKWQLTNYTLVSPDLGAFKKIEKLAASLNNSNEIVTGIKIRNLATGQIIKSDVNCADLAGKDCLIVDDICDGGRTFIELAKILQQKNAGKIYFFCTHGIFSHDAVENLHKAGFTAIATTNSIREFPNTDFLTVLPIL